MHKHNYSEDDDITVVEESSEIKICKYSLFDKLRIKFVKFMNKICFIILP